MMSEEEAGHSSVGWIVGSFFILVVVTVVYQTETTATMAATAPLDFAALLNRKSRPARVTFLTPKEALKPDDESTAKKRAAPATKSNADLMESTTSSEERAIEEAQNLAHSLVTKTATYTQHAPPGELEALRRHRHDDIVEMVKSMPAAPTDEWRTLDSRLHEVELGDWERHIRWDGAMEERKSDADPTERTIRKIGITAQDLLRQKRNPYLDSLQFDETNISWEGGEECYRLARKVPLILELGTAGRSVAQQALSMQRPLPFGQTETYLQRYEREWSTPITSTAEVSKSLHADKEKMAKIIEARQKKRAQMAIDKTNRIEIALGTLQLGGGKGRTITSSLMGPGGTERTGRPSRASGGTGQDVEYLEHLDLVTNHQIIRSELTQVELRQYHRPKLPKTFVRHERAWQFQIRYLPPSKKTTDPTTGSYQSIMGSHPGSLSQARIRSEADLNPTEGSLILLEYSEEKPPIQLTKGHVSKIVNYYRGDKSRCPVSAGGGDRPTRRKNRPTESGQKQTASTGKLQRPPPLVGHDKPTKLEDWIGRMPAKKKRDDGDSTKTPGIDVLPEGITEMLYPKVNGPFIGEVAEGETQTGLLTNMFVAPMFRHEAESSDFLMILGRKPQSASRSAGLIQQLSVVLRPLPASVFTVGQVEPREAGVIHAPNSTGDRNFTNAFLSYLIAKALNWYERNEHRGLRFDEITDMFAHTGIQPNALRQRIKAVAVYDKNTQIWETKPITDYDDFPGHEALGRKVAPEGVATYHMSLATMRRMLDVGLEILFSGTNTVHSVGQAMVYFTGQMNAARDLHRKLRKTAEYARSNKNVTSTKIALYERAVSKLEEGYKDLRRKHEVAKFIFEELQLASWNLSFEFVDVHRQGHGTGMMKLTGLGDPSGLGEGYNFLRELDTKSHKGGTNTDGALNAQIKKITGTDNDLRKLTMKQMASLLRSYGLGDKEIKRLKRWDRVHVIRDLSTKAASDGMGDGLERFARGEKLKLSEQKEQYRARVQEIWRRQRQALMRDAASLGGGAQSGNAGADENDGPDTRASLAAKNDKDDSDSDDSDDEDLIAMMEGEMMDVQQTNQLVAAAGGNQDSEGLAKDARELAALKREREEEKTVQEGLGKDSHAAARSSQVTSMIGKKVIRRRITKIFPDGRQTTTFKIILSQDEVEAVIEKKKEEGTLYGEVRKQKTQHRQDNRALGHAFWEEDDDFEMSRSRPITSKRGRTMKGNIGKSGVPKIRGQLPIGRLKKQAAAEKRMKKRKKESEEADLYVSSARRKGTSNRRERGAARERMPHVIFSEKIESIRSELEKRPHSAPFHRPVSRRTVPRYYEVISEPIDLQTIRDKNANYQYRTADSFLKDLDLMRINAIKFNSKTNPLAIEATNIYEQAKKAIARQRPQLEQLEEMVEQQMGGKKTKKKKVGGRSKSTSPPVSIAENVVVDDGVAVNLGNLDKDFVEMSDGDSDDDSFSGMLGM